MYGQVLINEFGDQIERTPFEHPYTYDGFIIWRGLDNNQRTGTVYSDRLNQWDNKKFKELSLKHFDKESFNFGRCEPKKLEAFLCDYLEKEIKLVFIMEYCNKSQGYPYYRIDYQDVDRYKIIQQYRHNLINHLRGHVKHLNDLRRLSGDWLEANDFPRDCEWTGHPSVDAVIITIKSKKDKEIYTFKIELSKVL